MKDDLSAYLFHQGTNYKAYEYFGSHIAECDGVGGVVFRVWAPAGISMTGTRLLILCGAKRTVRYSLCLFPG